MGVYPIGGDRIGIVTQQPVLDDDGHPVRTEFGEPVYTDEPLVEWVDGCMFEIQTPSEQQNMTVTTSEIGWAMMPVADGQVPLVDVDGEPAGFKPVTDITSSLSLRHDGKDYVMRGDAVLEKTIRGQDDHVFCVSENEGG